VERDEARAEPVVREREDGHARRLQDVEERVVHRDPGRADQRDAPVAVDEQERERTEDVEVELEHPARLVDQQAGVRHQRRAGEQARQERPGPEVRGEQEAAGREAADEQRGHPRAVPRRERERDHEVADQEQRDEAVAPLVRRLGDRVLRGGLGAHVTASVGRCRRAHPSRYRQPAGRVEALTPRS
jgi:hypothetical protein